MNIAVIGASGFVGKNLIKYLLSNTDHNILALALDAESIFVEERYVNRIKKINVDFLNDDIEKIFTGIDVAYYLIHMMKGNKNDFYNKEEKIAEKISQALKSVNVKRVIYMSGLGRDDEKLSMHLSSRHNTGNILREYVKEVIELRASMIIGEGSISFEIVRNIIDKSPIVILPKWSKTDTQPIGLRDALLYLEESINLKINNHEIIEIGGSEKMSYREFIKRYVKFKNKKTIIIYIPILSEKIAGFFLNFFTSKDQACVGNCMLESFRNEMIITNNRAKELFPYITPDKVEESFE
jgi:uncharacterized protein YbjT (DUF2867 family)